jgi:hypothetical protein
VQFDGEKPDKMTRFACACNLANLVLWVLSGGASGFEELNRRRIVVQLPLQSGYQLGYKTEYQTGKTWKGTSPLRQQGMAMYMA